MATQSKDSSYQSLGNGVYRVTGAVRRSARTGLYVTKSNPTGAAPGKSTSTVSSQKAKKQTS